MVNQSPKPTLRNYFLNLGANLEPSSSCKVVQVDGYLDVVELSSQNFENGRKISILDDGAIYIGY